MAQPKTTDVEDAAGKRADFLVYYRRDGRDHFDAIFADSLGQALRVFEDAARELGWKVEVVRVEARDPEPSPRRYLDARFDITELNQSEVEYLWGEVLAQGESSEGHPDVEVEIEVVEHEDDD